LGCEGVEKAIGLGESSVSPQEESSDQPRDADPAKDPKDLKKKVICDSHAREKNKIMWAKATSREIGPHESLAALESFNSDAGYLKGRYTSYEFSGLTLDAEGIPMVYRRDIKRQVRHPVYIAQRLLGLLK
jgi:hypothetical protein